MVTEQRLTAAGALEADLTGFARAHYDDLLAYVRRKGASTSSALDIVQESFLRVMIAFRVRPIEDGRGYLFRIARNLLIDEARLNKTRGAWIVSDTVSEEHPCDAASPERMLMARQELELLMALVARLSPRCQEVFVMRRFEDIDQHIIAERLGISRRTVEKHLRLALRRCLEGLLDLRRREGEHGRAADTFKG